MPISFGFNTELLESTGQKAVDELESVKADALMARLMAVRLSMTSQDNPVRLGKIGPWQD